MTITIPDETVKATHLSEQELCTELALLLFEKNKLTLGQASKLAAISQLQFQHLLASRGIPIHYATEDFEVDKETIRRLSLNEPKR